MACLPYPSFINHLPVGTDDFEITTGGGNRKALSAAGSCRINPSAMQKIEVPFVSTSSIITAQIVNRASNAYEAIVAKNVEQASVERSILSLSSSASEEDKDKVKELKKVKKKYMKEGVAMASKYLIETLKLDVSIVNVEIVLESSQIMETGGCLCSCFLDAGCSAIVIAGLDFNAMYVAQLPKERIIASFTEDDKPTQAQVEAALDYASTISIDIEASIYLTDEYKIFFLEKVDLYLSYLGSTDNKNKLIIGVLRTAAATADTTFIANISTKLKDEKGKILLKDPTAAQLGTAYAACMRTDRPDKLYTTVVCTRSGEALGLVYSSIESIIAALECGRGVYYSRSRKGLWRKGDTSGHYQILHRLDVDCDGDALRFTVTQCGGDCDGCDEGPCFCHLKRFTCWGPPNGIRQLEHTMKDRLQNAPEGSYTKRLFEDAELLKNKLVEEAQELSEATSKEEVAAEFADVLYFAMARATKAGVSIDDAIAELDRRTRKVTRRQGDAKAFRIEAGNEILNNK
mmetsp:Transcript_57918/g.64791  ORF Transcript_57918/g.64791 Transcript_57918/m.64791 type:complete len:517 (+) Transcript_57918:216-1766(+)